MDSLTFKIRHNTLSETPRMFDIWESSVEATHHFLSPDEIKSIGIQVKEYLSNASFFILTETDNILGFMGMTENKIDSLFVDPKYFGKGIGKHFIKFAMSKHELLYVDVNEDNHQARLFYEKMGFVVIERSEFDDEGRPFPILKMKILTK